jgi:AcrR family transcriptional regulator
MLEAAAHILERDGLDGYSTNAIAERAGVSIGSLYQYFPGKAAITRALILREMTVLRDDIVGIDSTLGGKERLERLISAAVANQLRRPVLARLLDVDEARLPPDENVDRLAAETAQVFQEILAAADMPDTAAKPYVTGDVIAIIRGMVDAAGRRGETNAQGLVERVVRAVSGYLGL